MILIADSGSTKTAWRLIDASGLVYSIESPGLNPLFTSDDNFKAAIQTMVSEDWVMEEVSQVFFYGAGITDKIQYSKLESWLKSACTNAGIFIESDLLGAARAAFKDDSGIIGILGTGSNSAFYDGSKILKTIRSLGYILGDEGSGNAMGRKLISNYLRNELPAELVAQFQLYYLDHNNLLGNIYRSSKPASLLASFMPFIVTNANTPLLKELINTAFNEFIKILVQYNQSSNYAVVGSVAYVLQSNLNEVAAEHGIKFNKIIKSPIDDLVLYHQEKM